jgi:polysaccharide pyruvyl transferase WcaK-like protein
MGEIKKKASQKIIINNVVPLNNGDVALFLSLYRILLKNGYAVKIAAYNYDTVVKEYPDMPFIPELAQGFLFRKLPWLKPFLLPFLFLLSRDYRKADVIIGAPGGYVNSYYSIKSSLSIFKVAKRFGKKTAIYAQSVGPLNAKDSLFFKKLMAKSIDYVLIRDAFSNEVMESLQIPTNKYLQTKDAAFLLGYQPTEKTVSKKIAISVRKWEDDNRSVDAFKKMIAAMTGLAIDQGYEVDFLSTCQGLSFYKNDAVVAAEIKAELEEVYQAKVNVLADYYNFHQFYDLLGNYELVIGTRLHMCITALTRGIPALNISYEVKGKECYNYLDLAEYSIDYNEPIENAISAFQAFLSNQEKIREHLKSKIPETAAQVESDFKIFESEILTPE